MPLNKKKYQEIIETFPPFDMLISSRNTEKQIKELWAPRKPKQIEKKNILSMIDVVVDEKLPADCCLFIDHKKRIVAIYKDGTLVYSVNNKMNGLKAVRR